MITCVIAAQLPSICKVMLSSVFPPWAWEYWTHVDFPHPGVSFEYNQGSITFYHNLFAAFQSTYRGSSPSQCLKTLWIIMNPRHYSYPKTTRQKHDQSEPVDTLLLGYHISSHWYYGLVFSATQLLFIEEVQRIAWRSSTVTVSTRGHHTFLCWSEFPTAPILDAIDEDDFQDVKFKYSLWYKSPFKGPPTPQVDEAWHSIMKCK